MSQPPARARRSTTAKRMGSVPAPSEAPELPTKTPLWQRLADDLRERIESGELAPGDLLPSEAELTTAYDASRPTARRAVAALRAVGLVQTEHGRGTRVRTTLTSSPTTATLTFNPTVVHEPGTSTFTTWEATGWTDRETPSLYRTDVAHYAELLKLPAGEPTFIYERHLEHVSAARILHRLLLPFALVVTLPSLSDSPEVTPGELYQVLTEAGYTLRWRDTVHAEMPTPDDTASLAIPEGVPMLVHTRVIVAADDRPLALEETRLPADRASILTRAVQ
jgi:GntR family transcriptional regulator